MSCHFSAESVNCVEILVEDSKLFWGIILFGYVSPFRPYDNFFLGLTLITSCSCSPVLSSWLHFKVALSRVGSINHLSVWEPSSQVSTQVTWKGSVVVMSAAPPPAAGAGGVVSSARLRKGFPKASPFCCAVAALAVWGECHPLVAVVFCVAVAALTVAIRLSSSVHFP